MWLNVDFGVQKYSCRLHQNECRFVSRKPTDYKGIGELRKDGGWLHFETIVEAKVWHQKHYPEIPWKLCKSCLSMR